MAILDRLLVKYPQIDPSRVYVTGLSAGAMNSLLFGMNNISRIAGVAGHSAPFDDIPVPDAPDLSVNEMFGLRLDGSGWGALAGRRAMIGTLSNKEGVMMKLVALDPYRHWNFKPAAADMWAFLSRFRRDLTTGALHLEPIR